MPSKISEERLQLEINQRKKQGYLMKQSKHLKRWRDRWFVLTPNYLLSFKRHKRYSNPTEAIELQTIKSIYELGPTDSPAKFGFAINLGEREYLLTLEYEDEKKHWLQALKGQPKQHQKQTPIMFTSTTAMGNGHMMQTTSTII